MKVELYATQVKLLDEIVAEGKYGKTREEVLRATIREHANYLLIGGGMFDFGPRTVVETKKPKYGEKRYDYLIQPVTGVAVPVYKGEVIRIKQTEGGVCVDLNAYNLHDYKEQLSCGMSRQSSGHWPAPGYMIYTSAPRGRPIYVILEMPETCKTWIIGHRCNAVYFERKWASLLHPNCQDTFAEAIREYGLTPDDTHDSFNLWAGASLDVTGKHHFEWNPAQKGDCVDLLALFATLAVPIICGGDLNNVNNDRVAPIAVEIFSPSPSTLELVEVVNKKWGSYRMQQKPKDFKVKDIRIKRELEPDPNHKPEYIPVPKVTVLDVNVTPEEKETLQSLMKTNQYGASEAEAIRACFVRWYNALRLKEQCGSLLIR